MGWGCIRHYPPPPPTQEDCRFIWYFLTQLAHKGDFTEWCPEAESNHRHKDFQSFALPTELSGHHSFRIRYREGTPFVNRALGRWEFSWLSPVRWPQ